jgi:hypothetical protein
VVKLETKLMKEAEMNIPNFAEEAFTLIEKYNKQFPRHIIGTLDLNPELEEQDMIKYLEESMGKNKPITFRNKKVYIDPNDLPEGALW